MSVNSAYLGIILIWSTTPLAIKWSGEEVDFLFGLTARMVIGTVIAFIILLFMGVRLQWHKQALLTYMSASLAIYGSMMCVYWGAQYITSGMVSVLFGLTPMLTSVFAAIILKENSLSAHKLMGIALAITGLVIIFYTDMTNTEMAVLGIIAIVISSTIHSLSTVLVKKVNAKMPGIVITAGSLLISTILFVLTWVFSQSEWPEIIPVKAGASILYLGVFGSVIGFTLYYYALKFLTADKMGLIPLITPAIALILGHLINHEPLGMKLIIGAGLIMAGLVLHNLKLHRPIAMQNV